MLRLSSFCAAVGVLLLPGVVRASSEDIERQLNIAEEAFLDVEYEGALEALLIAEDLEGATDEQLARLYSLRGTLYYLQEDERLARIAYQRVLAIDPSYQLPEEHPPRAALFLDNIRQERDLSLTIEHQRPSRFEQGAPLLIEASVRGLLPRHSLMIFYRIRGERNYSSTEMVRGSEGMYVGEIPTAEDLHQSGGEVEYFIVVADGENRIANEGSPRNPLSFVVNGETGPQGQRGARRSIARSWWFWTLIGGSVAVGLGVGLGLGLRGDEETPTGGVQGTLRFE